MGPTRQANRHLQEGKRAFLWRHMVALLLVPVLGLALELVPGCVGPHCAGPLGGPLLGGQAWAATGSAGPGPGGQIVVGVSWGGFDAPERWRQDETSLHETLTAANAVYLSADARNNTEKQVADIDRLVSGGANVLLVATLDPWPLLPALARARQKGIPVIAYDRPIDATDIFHIGFDNREAGRIGAREVLRRHPRGTILVLLGSPHDLVTPTLFDGMLDVLRPAAAKGNITVASRLYVEGLRPDEGEKAVAAFLSANPGKPIDAVLAGNDRLAASALAALEAGGREGVVISGQDADKKAVNRIARGGQAVTVFKDVRQLARVAAQTALALAAGTPPATIPHTIRWQRTPDSPRINAVFLAPVPVTRDTLRALVEADWATQDEICAGIPTTVAPSLCW